jgi:hypothetical protein
MADEFVFGYIIFTLSLIICIKVWYNRIKRLSKRDYKLKEIYVNKLSRYIYTTIHYDMNELYEIYELREMNRIYEINSKITDLHKTYYKYQNYITVIGYIKSQLILLKERELLLQMKKDIRRQKLLISSIEYNELKLMKLYGLKTDMIIYKKYLRDFFNSLNELNEIIIY